MSSKQLSATERFYPPFTHWFEPKGGSVMKPPHHEQQAMNMADLPEPYAHPTLLFYISGTHAQELASITSMLPSPAKEEALKELFEPYYALLPNYSPSSPDCAPSGFYATAWAADEFAGYGSYSNFPVGMEEADKDVEALREGAPDQRMWLAGEHTAPFDHSGTVSGAWISGDRVAERILNAYGIEK